MRDTDFGDKDAEQCKKSLTEETGGRMRQELIRKYERLKEKMRRYTAEGAAVAFSGGVDSALLLKLACMAAEADKKVYAVTVQTKLHPSGDMEAAKRSAAEAGAIHKILQIDELAESGIENNPLDRCYLCKREIFRKIKSLAEELGAGYVLEGTNADDLYQYRPGIRALRELQIISPLCECGMTKAEIRELAGYLGISAANRPSSPCLATRLPYGTRISYELLERIDEGERYLHELGFYNVRLRIHELPSPSDGGWKDGNGIGTGNIPGHTEGKETGKSKAGELLARIEVDREDIPKLLDRRKEVVEKIKKLGFERVTADLEGFRSGSMDRNLNFSKS